MRPSSESKAARWTRDVLGNLLLAGAYFGVAKIALAAATEHRVVSSLYPPAGIALFALIRFGVRFWPGVALGAWALNATSGIGIFPSSVIALGDTLEPLVGVLWLRRVAPNGLSLDRVRDVLGLTFLGGVACSLIAAVIGVTTLVISGAASSSLALSLAAVWWTGDAVGILVVTPLLLAWTMRESQHFGGRARHAESAALFLAMALLTDFFFTQAPLFVFAIFPVGIWIGWRFGPRGAATASAVMTLVAAWRTLSLYGPFTALSPTENLFSLQLFLALFAVKNMLFAAAHSEALDSAAKSRWSEKRYRHLAQKLPDGCVAVYDRDLRIVLVEGPALYTAGFTKEGVEGKRLADIFDPAHATALGQPFVSAIDGNEMEFEFAYNERVYLIRVLPLEEGSGPQLGMALALDVTARESARREVMESKAQLERLSRLLLTAQEDERRRIAREVHDELGQALTAVKISLAHTMGRVQRRNSLESERRISNASDLLDRAIASVQRIVLRLRPGVLDNLGPLAALEYEVQQFREQSSLEVTLQLPPEPLALDAEQSTVIYRTVQEALTNVMRHAEAQRVSVSLLALEHELLLQVADDGKGIADDQLQKPRSMGLLGMRERAASCGGRLDIVRVASGGTCLMLRIPLYRGKVQSNGTSSAARGVALV